MIDRHCTKTGPTRSYVWRMMSLAAPPLAAALGAAGDLALGVAFFAEAAFGVLFFAEAALGVVLGLRVIAFLGVTFLAAFAWVVGGVGM